MQQAVTKSACLVMCLIMLFLLLLHDLFRGIGAWPKSIEPQKPGNSPGPGPEVAERQRVAKEHAAQSL